MAAENFKVKNGLEVGTGSTITSGGINVTGVITATQLVGDGSGLTNVVGSGSGIVVKDEGSAVGTAGTINFVGSGVVASLSAGQATITISSGGLNDVVDDTTPQLGGGLDLNSKFISGSGGINVTGIVTATTFVGNGDFVDLDVDGHTELDDLNVSGITTSALLDVGNLTNGRVAYVGSTSGRLVDSANLTFDGTSLFVSGINVVSGGTTSTFGADIVTRNLNVTGVSTFGGVVNISDIRLQSNSNQDLIQTTGTSGLILENTSGITLKQRHHPNWTYASFASGGVILRHNNQTRLTTTASGITVPDLHATGVGTFATRIDTNGISLGTNNNNFAAKFVDNAVANFGTDNDLKISHNNTDAIFENTTGQFVFKDTAGEVEFKIQGHESSAASLFLFADEGDDPNDRWKATAHTDGNLVLNYFRGATSAYAKVAQFTTDAGTQLFHTAVKKFETTGHGVVVSGVCTATSFNGDGSGLTGVTASGTGIIVQHDGSNVGTAGTINFSTNLDVTPIHAGIVTVTASGGSGATDKIEEGDTKVETVDSGDAADAYVTTEVNGNEEIRTIGGQTTVKYLRVGSNWNMSNTSGTGIALGFSNTHDYIASSSTSGIDIQSNTSVELGQNGSPNNKYASFTNLNGIFRANNIEKLRYAAGGIDVTGICTATSFSGSGIGLTSLNADNLGSGEIPNGRFPATLPTVSGANLTNLPVPTQITVTNESSDQTCNILFTTAATGDLAPKSSSTLTYDANGEVLSATLFSGSGASLTNLNASNIGSGTMSASRLTGALPAISGASLTNLPASTPTTSDIQVVYEITNQSSFSYFRFAGNGVDSSANNPDIYLTRGQKYRFINNSGGSHPFQIQTTASSAYTTGVTYPSGTSASSGNIDFAVRWDAPSQLKYVCLSHGAMVGNIYIDGGDAGRRTTANAATGSIANAAAANISITAAKTYSLLKVQTSAAAWVTLYTDSTSRSNDASRGETTDPTPGSGVIAEVITSGAATQILSPGVIGWNNDSTPASTVYAKVVNKSGSTQAITVTLHYLAMEI